MFKGWKTILFNGGLVVILPLLQYLAGVNWVEEVGPTYALVIVAVINVILRVVTDTPVFRKTPR